jgi:hypothetical protein
MTGVVVPVATATWFAVPVTLVTVPEVAGETHEGGDPVVAVKTCPVVPSANMLGTPDALVIRTPLFAVAKAAMVLAAEA